MNLSLEPFFHELMPMHQDVKSSCHNFVPDSDFKHKFSLIRSFKIVCMEMKFTLSDIWMFLHCFLSLAERQESH